jgi:hypothetical protein
VAVELVVGLGVVFAAFAENVGADVQGGALLSMLLISLVVCVVHLFSCLCSSSV